MKKIQKTITVLLLVVSLLIAFSVCAYAVTEAEVQAKIAASSKEAVSGNIFIWFLCAIAFLKISQKIDSFMSSLGISVGHTGGSMLAEAMLLTRGLATARGGGGFGFGRGGGSGGGSPGRGQPGGSLGLSGGLAGVVGRQLQNDAIGSATGTGGNLLSNQAFNSSLKKDGAFANGVIGAVAKGNMSQLGSITGDKASAALSSYMGLGKGGAVPASGHGLPVTPGGVGTPGSVPGSTPGTVPAGMSGPDATSVPIPSAPDDMGGTPMESTPLDGAQALENGGVPSFDPSDAVDYDGAASALETAIGENAGVAAYPLAADELSEMESDDGHHYPSPSADYNSPGGSGIPPSPDALAEEALADSLASGGSIPSYEPSDSVDYGSEASAHEAAMGSTPGVSEYPGATDDTGGSDVSGGSEYTPTPVDIEGVSGIPESPYSSVEEGTSESGSAPSGGPSDTVDYANEASAYSSAIGGTPGVAEYPGAVASDTPISTESGGGSEYTQLPVESSAGGSIPSSPYSTEENVAESSAAAESRAPASVGSKPMTPDSVNTIPESPYSGGKAGGGAVESGSPDSIAAAPVTPGSASTIPESPYSGADTGASPQLHTPPISAPASGAVERSDSGTVSSAGSSAAPVSTPSIPKFENVEIGGGRITGREVTTQHPSGREFAMYHTDQYTTPQGPHTVVKMVDNSKWYKQYAVDAVERTPKMGKNGKVEYNEKIVQVMPPVPKRKDRI